MAITKVTTPELIDLPNNQLATVNTDGVVLPKGPTVPGSVSVEYLAVAGGGGTSNYNGGGGGAGGLLNASITMNDSITYTIVIGEGGALSNNTDPVPATSNGDDSTLNGSDITLVTATGGGKGGLRGTASNNAGGDGGSGGGGGSIGSGGNVAGSGNTPSTSPSQGFAGGVGADGGSYRGGGGGGAGAAGGSSASGGSGGVGLDMSAVINNTNAATASVGEVSGSAVYFAGGGGAGANSSPGSGGLGGGGNGGTSSPAGQGTEGTGGGGGGGSYPAALNAAKGGRGVVILRYDATRTATTSGFTAEAGPYTEGDYKVLVLKQGTGTVTFSGTPTVGRPVTGGSYILEDGEFRYNTTTKKVEYYDGADWFTLDSSTAVPQAGTTGVCNYPTTATALYQLNDNANDTCGNYNAVATNITYTTGNFGNAAVFNGSSSFIDLNLKNQFKGTVSIWFNGGTPSAQSFLYASTAGSSGNKGIALLPQTNGTIRVLISQGTSGTNALDMSTTDTFFDSNWYNAVLTWDLSISGTNVYLYVNNVVKASGSATTGNWTTGQDSTSNLILGHYNNSGGSETYNGKIDQVRIFTSVLTATQVGYLYTETAP